MKCPGCHNETFKPETCNQCGSTFCPSCQPYFDYTNHVCQGCQEINSVEAIREVAFSERMRRWFSKAAPLPEPTGIIAPPPWGVQRDGSEWVMFCKEDDRVVARFDDLATAEYACHAANAYFDLAMIAALTHNRIREGGTFWTGTKRDCELWSKVRGLIK